MLQDTVATHKHRVDVNNTLSREDKAQLGAEGHVTLNFGMCTHL